MPKMPDTMRMAAFEHLRRLNSLGPVDLLGYGQGTKSSVLPGVPRDAG